MGDLARKVAIMVVLCVVLLSFVGWKVGFFLSSVFHISKGLGGTIGVITGGLIGFFLLSIISKLKNR